MKESGIYQEWIQEGSQEKARQIAVKMLAEGMDVELIARMTDLTPEQIRQVAAGANTQAQSQGC